MKKNFQRWLMILAFISVLTFTYAETNSQSNSSPQTNATTAKPIKPVKPVTTVTPTPVISQEESYLNRLNKDPQNSSAYYSLLKLYNIQGKHFKRIRIASQAIRNLGEKSNLYQIIGDEYKLLKDYNKALIAYQKAVQLNPTGANTYNRLGLVLLKLSRFNQAEVAFKAAVYYMGNGSAIAKGTYINNLGVSYESRQNYKMAARYFKQSLSYYPSYGKAKSNYDRVTEILQKQGNE